MNHEFPYPKSRASTPINHVTDSSGITCGKSLRLQSRLRHPVMLQLTWFLMVCLLTATNIDGLDNGQARTPPMGWMDWEAFRCNINCKTDPNNCIGERLFMQMADHLASDGYLDAGYKFVDIDDCWASKTRDAQGRLVANPDAFPSGIKALSDYIHRKGRK